MHDIVTGGAECIGSHLAGRLAGGAEIIVIDNRHRGSWQKLAAYHVSPAVRQAGA